MNYLVLNDRLMNGCNFTPPPPPPSPGEKMTNPEVISRAYALFPLLLPHQALLSP